MRGAVSNGRPYRDLSPKSRDRHRDRTDDSKPAPHSNRKESDQTVNAMTQQLMKPRIWVDFQNCDSLVRVRLDTVGTVQDLNRLGLVLRHGLEVSFYCLELEAEGLVLYSDDEQRWVGAVDWERVQDREGNR